MAFWLDIAAFALKALLIVAALGGLAFLIARLTRGEAEEECELEVHSLNERLEKAETRLNRELLPKKQGKALAKARKKAAKADAGKGSGKRLYVIDFKGDIRASAVKQLGREIDAVLTVARPRESDMAVSTLGGL